MQLMGKNFERLPACDKYHHNLESDVWVSRVTGRRHCRTCDKYRRMKPQKPRSTPKGMAYEPYGERLGVYRLSWKPPHDSF